MWNIIALEANDTAARWADEEGPMAREMTNHAMENCRFALRRIAPASIVFYVDPRGFVGYEGVGRPVALEGPAWDNGHRRATVADCAADPISIIDSNWARNERTAARAAALLAWAEARA